VRNIIVKEEPISTKIVKGVEGTRGEMVSFLKDDDLWLPLNQE
jgi:hypothetical protein